MLYSWDRKEKNLETWALISKKYVKSMKLNEKVGLRCSPVEKHLLIMLKSLGSILNTM